MNGLQGVSQNSGWIVSVFLVMSALFVALLRKKKRAAAREEKARAFSEPQAKASVPPDEGKVDEKKSPLDIPGAIALYQPLIDSIGERFELVELYRLAREKDLPHPHLTITYLQHAGVLVSTGDGLYSWKP